MRTTTFKLPGIPPGQNTSTRGNGWQRNAALKKEWGDKMRWEIRAARIRREWDGYTFLRARVTARFHYPTRSRHDPDNAAGSVKFFLDAFTDECVIVDDDFDHIELLITAGPVHRPGYVEIIVEELEALP